MILTGDELPNGTILLAYEQVHPDLGYVLVKRFTGFATYVVNPNDKSYTCRDPHYHESIADAALEFEVRSGLRSPAPTREDLASMIHRKMCKMPHCALESDQASRDAADAVFEGMRS